jgi:hypothetical protein
MKEHIIGEYKLIQTVGGTGAESRQLLESNGHRAAFPSKSLQELD